MTSINWLNKRTGQSTIKLYKSKDALEKDLKKLKFDKPTGEKFLEIKSKGKSTEVLILQGVAYESDSEEALFVSYGILEKRKEEIANGN